MKHSVKHLVIILILLLSFSCAVNRNKSDSKSVITPLSGKLSVTDGSLIYALPLTVLDIIVETEHTIEKPGPYSRYAESLLGLSDIIHSENEYWSIRSVTIRSHEEPDPSEFYVIEASTLFQTNVLSLKKAGLILDLNPATHSADDNRDTYMNADLNFLRISDLGADEYFQASSDTLYKIVSVDTAFIKIPYLVEKKKKLTVQELAEKAAVRLMEMRDGKHLILTGEANVFPQNEASLNEMNRMEKEYTELFTGKIWKETRTFSYTLNPRKDQAGTKILLCRFSETKGPVSPENGNDTPLTLELIPEKKTKDLTLITRAQPESSVPKYDKLYYRVPDMVNLRISLGNEIFKTSRRLIYQFGEVIQLPSNYIIGK